MRLHDEARREADWCALYDAITRTLDRFGRKDPFGRGDYWLVDEDWGQYRQKLEVQNLNLLRPDIVKLLQSLLGGYPDWEIMFRVAVPGTENVWPAMGLVIHDDEVIDDLQREYLPDEFCNITYEHSGKFGN